MDTPKKSAGSALLITLGATALLSIVILAFFSRSLLERQISSSSASQIKADALARSALDIITGELREEIRAFSDPLDGGGSGYPVIYQPASAAATLPQRTGVTGTGAIVKLSANNTPVNPATGGRALGSVTSTTAASLNGRKWTLSRWYAGGPKIDANAAAPSWALLSRANSVIVRSDAAQVAGVKNPASGDYVIGRFAYAVYSLGGLADANAAGHPSLAASDAANRPSPAYADLDVFSSGLAGGLAEWRNLVSGSDSATFSEWATGAERSGGGGNGAALAAARSGHRCAALGDRFFFSRHDLLRNPQTAGAAAYLTHFSRCLNAPSWSPLANAGSGYSYQSNANLSASANRNLANVRAAATGTLTHYLDDASTETYPIIEGDPLLQRRFSLARLKWLQTKEEHPTETAYDEAIHACFGLVWNANKGRWDYTGSVGTAVQASIETLGAVAAEGREPNFFEWLKAAILEGSTGVPSAQKTVAAGDPTSLGSLSSGGQYYLENSGDLQILRIGANIIDCADTDSYPTILCFDNDLEVAGVENLPYFYCMGMVGMRQTTTSVTPNRLTAADLVWVPVFFNPSQSRATAGSGPANVSAAVLNGTLKEVKLSDGTSLRQAGMSKSLTSLPAISIAASGFRDAPAPGHTTVTSDASRLDRQVLKTNGSTYVDASVANVQGWNLFSYQREYGAAQGSYIATVTWPTGALHRILVQDLVIALQYTTRAGKVKNYATMAGHAAFPSQTGWNGSPNSAQGLITGFGPSFATAARLNNKNLDLTYFAALADPRTSRWGPSLGESRGIADAPSVSDRSDGVSSAAAFSALSSVISTSNRVLFPLWPQGGDKTGSLADKDGVVRRVDGSRGDDANLYRALSDAARRPVLLNRPYQNVGELGYVFRDTPWKTLNFCDKESADAALLDVFSCADEPAVTAGRFALNAPQALVQKSLLQDADQVSSTLAGELAAAYQSYAFDAATAAPTGSLPHNVAQISQFLGGDPAALDGLPLKTAREAAARALANTTQTRTWNLLIDVVAQAGRFPPQAATLDDFLVEGEKRYWLSIAIDRYTGAVIDEQLEPADD